MKTTPTIPAPTAASPELVAGTEDAAPQGRWTTQHEAGSGIIFIRDLNNRDAVAVAHVRLGSPNDFENAKLLAAAPALLALAQRWMTWANGPVVPIAVRIQLQEDTRAVIEAL